MEKIKSDLRSYYIKKRGRFSAQKINDLSISVVNNCLKLDLWDKSIFHLFMSSDLNNEIDTSFLLSVIQGKDKQPVIPKITENNHLDHYLLTDQTLLKYNKWGIAEPQSGIKISPKKIEVVFVPLLIFDLLGHRVGYGKGFYDLFLTKCPKETIKVGLSYFEPIDRIMDIQSHDVRIDYGITPNKIYEFSSF